MCKGFANKRKDSTLPNKKGNEEMILKSMMECNQGLAQSQVIFLGK